MRLEWEGCEGLVGGGRSDLTKRDAIAGLLVLLFCFFVFSLALRFIKGCLERRRKTNGAEFICLVNEPKT